jgi:hypothetical protein
MARFKMRYSPEIAIALGLVVLIGASAVAQGRAYPDLGRAPTAEQIRKWDIAIGQAGRELPRAAAPCRRGPFCTHSTSRRGSHSATARWI